MTRQEYFSTKEQLKNWASILKSNKDLYKNAQREGNFGMQYDIRNKTRITYLDFRSTHIFMSLLRGKTRTQIEHNFEEKIAELTIESKIRNLCEQFSLEANYDEQMRVIEITSKQEKIAI
jgi:hypothetical protein